MTVNWREILAALLALATGRHVLNYAFSRIRRDGNGGQFAPQKSTP
jgi:hypothetical protein